MAQEGGVGNKQRGEGGRAAGCASAGRQSAGLVTEPDRHAHGRARGALGCAGRRGSDRQPRSRASRTTSAAIISFCGPRREGAVGRLLARGRRGFLAASFRDLRGAGLRSPLNMSIDQTTQVVGTPFSDAHLQVLLRDWYLACRSTSTRLISASSIAHGRGPCKPAKGTRAGLRKSHRAAFAVHLLLTL